MPASPSIQNYQIPTGKVYFKPAGDPDFIDLGNVKSFSVANDVQKKEHFRSYGGKRTKDKTIITQVSATAKFTMDEITETNLAFFALSDTGAMDTDGNAVLKGLSNTQFEGTLRIIGDNDDGPQIDWEGDVSFVPSGDFFFVKDNDDFNEIAVEADVQEDDNGDFGTWTLRENV